MIATVTLNPSLDTILRVRKLSPNESNQWLTTHVYVGGRGIDVSRAVHEMGGETMAYGLSGGDAGRELEIRLDEEEIPFSFTPIAQDIKTNYVITETETRQQTRINGPGPQVGKRDLARFMRRLELACATADLIVVCGGAPSGVPDDVYYDIIARCRERGVRCILDSEGPWLAEGVKAKPYLVKPNVHEAEELLRVELPTEETVIRAALYLVEKGSEIAVISRGRDGLIAATRDEIVKAVPPSLRVRSTLGAGDCAVAGLAMSLASGQPLAEACRLAVAMGSACVLSPGARLCHRGDVENLLSQVSISRMAAESSGRAFLETHNEKDRV